jgi:hypothetical protein
MLKVQVQGREELSRKDRQVAARRTMRRRRVRRSREATVMERRK